MRSSRIPLIGPWVVGLLLAVAAVDLGVTRAHAEQPPVTYPASCEPSKVSKNDIERAHAVFLSGKQYLDESNYDKAVSYFVDAYSIDCSVHGILPIIATAYERKGDRAEAVRALAEYQQRAPGAPDHEVVERRIKNLRDQLAKDQPPAAVASSPSPSPQTSAPLAAPPISPAAPEATVVTASLPPQEPSPSRAEGKSSHLGPWILLGVGGAAVVTGAVLLGVGAGELSAALKRCPSRTLCAKEDAAQGNSGRTLEAAGVTTGVVGAVAIVAGLVWLVTQPSHPDASASVWRAAPAVGWGYAGVRLDRVF
ncbi:MAG: hypothetical protein M3O50_07410 [Myxococcota bacterium]|nr:hypothetical protein [Myxococcota bacterium]